MSDAPALSVIIPTHGRADTLRLTLRAFDRQETDAPFEIVVCDDGSADHTGAVIARAAATGRMPVVHLHQVNSGANVARNRAIDAARGERLLIVNDDTIPAPNLVAAHLAAHARRGGRHTAILGRMTIDPALPFSPFSALHHDASYDALAGREEVGWDAFLTCNVSVDRAFLLEAGGFDPRLTWHEDIELGERLARRGMRLFYEPGALGYHHHLLDEAAYLRIAEREGAALVLWYRKRPDLAAELARLGLVGPPPLGTAVRHRLADLAMPTALLPGWQAAARALTRLNPEAGRRVWRRLFQRRKRLAIARALAA
ncbi:glycosyltransferase family A protein [Methylobacterium sp. NEAU 140]|uniref:glycosyltransferase family 2 protein n=1 Tax=Methylobacterium sp. NEAU 140 TaxID=3064945 RepID=UPI00273698B5|nr:glycosyltransferase family A protein [Methylobacterium sp. NEAU 140]MDP4021771.1 glycosyltransferase family A protein [Methylobacterium sp. NEAU 140]